MDISKFMMKRSVHDTPPNSLKDSNVNPKLKTMKEGIGVCSFTRNILGVRGAC